MADRLKTMNIEALDDQEYRLVQFIVDSARDRRDEYDSTVRAPRTFPRCKQTSFKHALQNTVDSGYRVIMEQREHDHPREHPHHTVIQRHYIDFILTHDER